MKMKRNRGVSKCKVRKGEKRRARERGEKCRKRIVNGEGDREERD